MRGAAVEFIGGHGRGVGPAVWKDPLAEAKDPDTRRALTDRQGGSGTRLPPREAPVRGGERGPGV